MGIRESFVQQLLVQGSSWGQQAEGNTEEEGDEIWKAFLMQRGVKLTSPGLSVHSGALVLVLAQVLVQVQVLVCSFLYITTPRAIVITNTYYYKCFF